MIKVEVWSYETNSVDYEALLLGWVQAGDQTLAVVTDLDGGDAWKVPIRNITVVIPATQET